MSFPQIPVSEDVAAIKGRLLSSSSSSQKQEDIAFELKELGNRHFQRKNKTELQNALKCYTKALFRAPWPSKAKQAVVKEQLTSLHVCKQTIAEKLHSRAVTPAPEEDGSLLATCFGNRSAVLYELGKIVECLEDIETALRLNFPQASEYKLHRRKACCLAHLGQKKDAFEALRLTEQAIDRSNLSKPKQDQLLKEQQSIRKKIQGFLMDNKKTILRGTAITAGSATCHLSNAYESKYICVQSSLEKGRFLEATESIRPGEVLMREDPFAAVLKPEFSYSHCSHCFQKSVALIPCICCCSEGYCSSKCRVKAWQKYHWLECPVAHKWGKFDWMLCLCLRIVLSAKPWEMHAHLQHTGKGAAIMSPYSLVHSLVDHKDKFSEGSQKAMLEEMADVLTRCFGEVILKYLQSSGNSGYEDLESPPIPEIRDHPTSDVTADHPSSDVTADHPSSNVTADHPSSDVYAAKGDDVHSAKDDAIMQQESVVVLDQVKKLFLHHLLQLRCNTHTISTVIVDEAGSGEECVRTTEAKLGSAVYPSASLMNHSCYPNALFRFTGCQVAVVATREIQHGQEINNCYGPQVGRMKRTQRRAALRRKFFFECHCPACEKTSPELLNREVVMDALACPHCKGALQQVDGFCQCLKCKHVLPETELEQHFKRCEEAQIMFRTAIMGGSLTLSLLLKCHKLQSQVLHAHNMELARTNDTLAQAYVMQGDFQSACYHSELSSNAVEAVYGNDSIELAQELHKLSQLFFQNHQYSRALQLARKAWDVLIIYQTPDHPDCIELSEMINLLQTQL